MIYRCILPDWAADGVQPKVKEGSFSEEYLRKLNEEGYNIYFYPNYPSQHAPGTPVNGAAIDVFRTVFVDMDLKSGVYPSKEAFIQFLLSNDHLLPTMIVDSGNGIHAYWFVSDLDAMSFLRLQRRLMRYFKTDEAVCKISQLMRMPHSVNTKDPDDLKLCKDVAHTDALYSCEELDRLLPNITTEDETYCVQHYNKTYQIADSNVKVEDKLPMKFCKLLRESPEIRTLWTTLSDDRSKSDFRLGHILFAHGFTKDEAMSVLIQCEKAMSRAPHHRIGYAQNIIDKIWTYELETKELNRSRSVADILSTHDSDSIKGVRFACHKYLDNTEHGFRLGQVIGLVAGSGVGKTAIALNMFKGFVENNPDYIHFFVPLEQPAKEIAERWKNLCGDNTRLHDKVHIMSNETEDGGYQHLSFNEIKEYILKFKKITNKKVGCVVIDHIGALDKKKGHNGENQDLMDICHKMKGFAVETNTLLVMQSQAPREKAGIGDLELNKDAAYGTVFFESYCDYLLTTWQPLKRCYREPGCPTVTALRFCKIRHKKVTKDVIQEDTNYKLYFDPNSGVLREMNEDEERSFDYFNKKATNKRKVDRKTDLIEYVSLKSTTETPIDESNGTVV